MTKLIEKVDLNFDKIWFENFYDTWLKKVSWIHNFNNQILVVLRKPRVRL